MCLSFWLGYNFPCFFGKAAVLAGVQAKVIAGDPVGVFWGQFLGRAVEGVVLAGVPQPGPGRAPAGDFLGAFARPDTLRHFRSRFYFTLFTLIIY